MGVQAAKSAILLHVLIKILLEFSDGKKNNNTADSRARLSTAAISL